MRAQTEAEAAAHSEGLVRARHEEFAVAYQMRVMCIDKGYADDPTGPLEPAPAAAAAPAEVIPMPQMIVLA
jgi:hypothetical protein